MEMLQGVWKQHLRPRALVGYGIKSFLPSPPNYVTRSPGGASHLILSGGRRGVGIFFSGKIFFSHLTNNAGIFSVEKQRDNYFLGDYLLQDYFFSLHSVEWDTPQRKLCKMFTIVQRIAKTSIQH